MSISLIKKLQDALESDQKMTSTMEDFAKIRTSIDEDMILLFEMGSFFEILMDDAVFLHQKVPQLDLTSRGTFMGDAVDLIGFPSSKLDKWAQVMKDAGINFAIARQVGERSDGSKIREITDCVTLGSPLILSDTDNARYYNTMLLKNEDSFSWVAIDIVQMSIVIGGRYKSLNELFNDINPKDIKELYLISNDFSLEEENIIKRKYGSFESVSNSVFESDNSRHLSQVCPDLKKRRDVSMEQIKGFGVISYILKNRRQYKGHANFEFVDLSKLERSVPENSIVPLHLNALEDLFYSKYLKTAMGKDLFSRRIRYFPALEEVKKQYDQINKLILNQDSLKSIEENLKKVINYRVMLGKVSKSKMTLKDIYRLSKSIKYQILIKDILSEIFPHESEFKNLRSDIEISKRISVIFNEDFFLTKQGHPLNLDKFSEYKEIVETLQDIELKIDQMQTDLRQKFKIDKLKVIRTKRDEILIEVPNGSLSFLEGGNKRDLIFVKTLKTTTRYENLQSRNLSNIITNGVDKIEAFENQVLLEMSKFIKGISDRLSDFQQSMARIDCLVAHSLHAVETEAVCPTISNDVKLVIKNGIRSSSTEDCVSLNYQNSKKVSIITGPNGSGKSSFLRTITELFVLARIGGFVEAYVFEYPSSFNKVLAKLSVSDSRVASTFEIEMEEMSYIFNKGDSNSLILIDEVGRGTSSREGKAIAQAMLEKLIELSSRSNLTFFATHYLSMAEKMSEQDLEKIYMGYITDSDRVRFNYTVEQGVSKKSFAINAASRFGVSRSVLDRAKQLYADSSYEDLSSLDEIDQIRASRLAKLDKLEEVIGDLNPNEDSLTKIQEFIARVKSVT